MQVIAFVCVLVWLINYHHFLTWRWRGFKKLADPFFVPDPSTIHIDLGPMVSRRQRAGTYHARLTMRVSGRLPQQMQSFPKEVAGSTMAISMLSL